MYNVVLINWFHNKKSLTIFELDGVSFGLLEFLDFGIEESSVTCTSSSSSPCSCAPSPTEKRHTSVIELPLLLGDLLSIMHSYGFCFEAQKTIFNLSWSVLPESNANDNLKTLRTFARNFLNIDFFLKMLPLKDDELVMSETQKRWGVTNFVLERACPEEHLNLSESGFVSEEGNSPKILQLQLWREMFCAKYDLNGPMKRFYSTGQVPQRTRSHLTTTISSALHLRSGRIRCLADRNRAFFLLPTLIFCSFVNNVEIIVNKICFWKEK